MNTLATIGIYILVLPFVALGCDKQESQPERKTTVTAPTSAITGPKPRVFFVARERDRCVVYWRSGSTVSHEQPVRCPREIEPGERMRLSGHTCFRESEEPTRRIPIRCDKSIIAAQDDYRKQAPSRLRARQRPAAP